MRPPRWPRPVHLRSRWSRSAPSRQATPRRPSSWSPTRAGAASEFSITGYLSEAALLGRARQVLAPVAAHRHLSASASIGSWLAAGRRPLVTDSSYAREIEQLRPGTIRRYQPDQLRSAITDALADPASTWLAPDVELQPGRIEVGAAYLDWWTREAGW